MGRSSGASWSVFLFLVFVGGVSFVLVMGDVNIINGFLSFRVGPATTRFQTGISAGSDVIELGRAVYNERYGKPPS